MKAQPTTASAGIAAAKIAAILLIAALALSCSAACQASKMPRADIEYLNLLITIAAISSSLAVLFVTQRNMVRVLVNVPMLLVCTVLGILAVSVTAKSEAESAANFGIMVFFGGSSGAILGYILLTLAWTFAKWGNWWHQPPGANRASPGESGIPPWRWESNGAKGA
jgi:hypothetical protein